ncbi:glycoside hydrolase family 16 protein [Armillaria borealis]|uniref:Glycoside hydrolase family 16 protein n=1 Tax=Armillaria borealis TaxID=47425 RepID=A0AA39IC06_9AGAR|nr:glycoside hydrolase family 16 protein [Armillaria borealis]
MHSFVALFTLALPVFASALGHDHVSRRHRRNPNRAASAPHVRKATYTLKDMYQGQSFLDEWDFFSQSDPTNGLVDYQTKQDATSKGLAYVQDDGTTILKVDNSTTLQSGQNRASVRISSKTQYSSGLFIADIYSMPHGCSVWPAYWSVGPDWPNAGEIDVLEGVNQQDLNQYTLHTGSGCSLTNANAKVASGRVLGTTCTSSNGDNSGCAFQETDARSYGHNFNLAAGGVYAHLLADDGISIWFFSRDDIPTDITSQSPDPSSWSTPSAFFPSTSCSISDHFYDHSLTIDTTLCGDWAGAAYGSDGSCPGTCAEAVADPSNFDSAHWALNYIAVYQS